MTLTSDSPASVLSSRALSLALGQGGGGIEGGTAALSWRAPNGLADGNTLIIETDGSYNFGNGPQYWFWPGFEGYSAGDSVGNDSYYQVTKSSPIIDSGYGLIGGKSVTAYNNAGTPADYKATFSVPDASALNGKKVFQEVFFTYTQRVPNDTELAGPGNQKPAWLMLGDRGDNFDYPAPDGSEGHDLYVINATGGGPWGSAQIAGNHGSSVPSPSGWTIGGFNTDQFFCKLNAADPLAAPDDYYASRTGTSFGTASVRGSPNTPLDTDPGHVALYQAFGWDRVKLPAYYDDRSGVRPQIVHQSANYAAFGQNAWAHVDLCDSADEGLAGKRVIARPVSWVPNRIEVVLNAGHVDIHNEGVLQIRLGNGTLLPLSLVGG